MQLRVALSVETLTAGRQQYISRNRRLMGYRPSNGTIVVPGASSCCEGTTSSSCAW
jgi:hypothetical protein